MALGGIVLQALKVFLGNYDIMAILLTFSVVLAIMLILKNLFDSRN